MLRRLLLGCFVAAVVAACGGNTWALPDRTDPKVQQTERKLAGIVEVGKGWEERWETCEVRLLGGSEPTYYVWALCQGQKGVPGDPAVSVPLRIQGEVVTGPRDGNLYADDVRRLFPEDLADEIFDHSERLQP